MKILIIQTAFLGDVVLATAVIEDLIQQYPTAQIDFLVRKGNESILQNNPHLRKVIIWQKKEQKWKHWWQILQQIRQEKYDILVNLQRFFSTGLWTFLSKAKITIGFNKNPFSWSFTHAAKHVIGNGTHEVVRNRQLISPILTQQLPAPRPAMYPSEKDKKSVESYQITPYVCIAPASVWFTKQFPIDKWRELIAALPKDWNIYLIAGKEDQHLCEKIAKDYFNVFNLAGKLSLLQSAALMQKAIMNYTNDSAPMHLASAVDAPITAIYCSTLPTFGFGPVATRSFVIETQKKLSCRPCGVHGKPVCPQKHFECAYSIKVKQLLETIETSM